VKTELFQYNTQDISVVTTNNERQFGKNGQFNLNQMFKIYSL